MDPEVKAELAEVLNSLDDPNVIRVELMEGPNRFANAEHFVRELVRRARSDRSIPEKVASDLVAEHDRGAGLRLADVWRVAEDHVVADGGLVADVEVIVARALDELAFMLAKRAERSARTARTALEIRPGKV